MQVEFRYSNLSGDRTSLKEPWEFYLGIVADFELSAGDQSLFTEQMFTVVEFAVQSQKWAREVVHSQRDFEFTSMESDDAGLVWIRRERSGWRLGSVFQNDVESAPVSLNEVTAALADFFVSLRAHVMETFRYDIETLLGWASR